ncbi:DUF4376 domain-containing protein [Salipiger abyssi]|uniref:Putative DUF4376 protein n=1 Tax=Salipiger abyssi TaxID=1250539 RepID=A0A1P8UWJ2_9RHOB|nr:DUF4376 domain-containing protein [Salipiger abyssi]APZ53757.1 putative DUF4376 protein [Salipiger abyssi]
MSNIDLTRIITAEDKTAAEQARRKSALHAERRRRVEAGTVLALSFGSIPVQGRAFDQSVILGLSQRAAALQSAGDTTTTLTYRDADNAMHELTAAQFLELAAAATAWIEAVMQASWTMIDSGQIPADFADDAHWPT